MSRLRRLGLKRAAALAVGVALVIGAALVIDSLPPSSVEDKKEVVKSRADRLCSAYRIACTLRDSPDTDRLQVLIGRRDGETARIAIAYGDVPWRLIGREVGCPKARDEFACDTIEGFGQFDADGADLLSYGPSGSRADPNQPGPEEDELGVTPLYALKNDLGALTEPSVLAYARFRGWDDWDDFFEAQDTRPLEPCRPGRKIWRVNPYDGTSSRPPGLRPCLLVNRP